MRHRKRGRHLGRSSSHRWAMFRNLASALILTERDAEFDPNPPKVKGRIITTLEKAKEIRPLVEKCVTIARRALKHEQAAEAYATDGGAWHRAVEAMATKCQLAGVVQARGPAVTARRRALQLLGDPTAVRVLFEDGRVLGLSIAMVVTHALCGSRSHVWAMQGPVRFSNLSGRHDRVTAASERPLFEDSRVHRRPRKQLAPNKGTRCERPKVSRTRDCLPRLFLVGGGVANGQGGPSDLRVNVQVFTSLSTSEASVRTWCSRLPELRHIDLSRVAVSFSQARKASSFGLYASLTPMRFEGGKQVVKRRGRYYRTQVLRDSRGTRNALYSELLSASVSEPRSFARNWRRSCTSCGTSGPHSMGTSAVIAVAVTCTRGRSGITTRP